MFLLVSIAVILLASSTNGMYKGKGVDIRDYPHQVTTYSGGEASCGGAMIDNSWVLTTANCVKPMPHHSFPDFVKPYTVQVGAKRLCGVSDRDPDCGSFHEVDDVVLHPHHDPSASPAENNIALVHVKKSFRCPKDTCSPIKITSRSPKVGDGVLVTGYGNTSETNYLLSVKLKVAKLEHCKGWFNFVDDLEEKGHACTTYGSEEEKCSKSKDEGAPVVANHTLVGLLSWLDTCNDALLYTDVAHYRDWIKKIIK